MAVERGDLALLQDPVAQHLLQSPIPARVAYTWLDGTPRVVPIWFHWDGQDIVLGSPVNAPKLRSLPVHPEVAVTIDDTTWPHKVLLIRGTAQVEIHDGVVPEYAAAATRYFGPEQGAAWVDQLPTDVKMARIAIRPTWAAVLDFETRFPSALS